MMKELQIQCRVTTDSSAERYIGKCCFYELDEERHPHNSLKKKHEKKRPRLFVQALCNFFGALSQRAGAKTDSALDAMVLFCPSEKPRLHCCEKALIRRQRGQLRFKSGGSHSQRDGLKDGEY